MGKRHSPTCAALKDESSEVRWAVFNVLARLGREGAVTFAEAVSDRSYKIRFAILRDFEYLGWKSPYFVPALKKALDDEEFGIRYHAARVLLRIDRPTGLRLAVPALARLLEDEPLFARSIHPLLAPLGSDAEAAIPILVDVIKSKRKWWAEAIPLLGDIGPGARAAIPTLIEARDSGDKATQYAAVLALGNIDPSEPTTVQALRDQLAQVNDDKSRLELARVLACTAKKREAIDVLMELALGRVREYWRSSPDTRLLALDALGEMGPKAAVTLPALRKALSNKEDELRPWLAVTICRIGRQVQRGNLVLDERSEGFETMVELIRDGKLRGRDLQSVCQALGAEATRLVPVLVAEVKAPQTQEGFRDAVHALRSIGPAAVEAAPVLEALLRDSPGEARRVEIADTLA